MLLAESTQAGLEVRNQVTQSVHIFFLNIHEHLK